MPCLAQLNSLWVAWIRSEGGGKQQGDMARTHAHSAGVSYRAQRDHRHSSDIDQTPRKADTKIGIACRGMGGNVHLVHLVHESNTPAQVGGDEAAFNSTCALRGRNRANRPVVVGLREPPRARVRSSARSRRQRPLHSPCHSLETCGRACVACIGGSAVC